MAEGFDALEPAQARGYWRVELLVLGRPEEAFHRGGVTAVAGATRRAPGVRSTC